MGGSQASDETPLTVWMARRLFQVSPKSDQSDGGSTNHDDSPGLATNDRANEDSRASDDHHRSVLRIGAGFVSADERAARRRIRGDGYCVRPRWQSAEWRSLKDDDGR